MADLRDVVQGDYSQIDESTLCFETIPIYKIILFSILTLGLYQVIWFYRNWKILKIKFGYKVSPFWRAIFAPLTNYELFPIMQKYVKSFDNVKSFNADSFANSYLLAYGLDIIITLLKSHHNQNLNFSIGAGLGINFLSDLLNYAIPLVTVWSIFSFLFTVPIIARIQARINKINKQNFFNVPKNKLHEIEPVLLILIGKTIPWALHVLILTLIVYYLFPVNAKDQCLLGNRYKKTNLSRAFKWYKKSANQGYAEAQYKLAMMYQEGKGVPQDFEKACNLYGQLVRQSYKNYNTWDSNGQLVRQSHKNYNTWDSQMYSRLSQYKLAMMYQEGKGVPQDFEKACNLYKNIKINTITCFENVKFNPKEDVLPSLMPNSQKRIIDNLFELMEYKKEGYKLSKNFGDNEYNEQCKLGVMYEEGIGVTQDLVKAREYYREATSQKSIFANYMLGVMYEEGIGVTQDLAKACEYYRTMAYYYLYAQPFYNID